MNFKNSMPVYIYWGEKKNDKNIKSLSGLQN